MFGYLDVIIDVACALLDPPDIAIDLLKDLFDHCYLIVDMVCGFEGSPISLLVSFLVL